MIKGLHTQLPTGPEIRAIALSFTRRVLSTVPGPQEDPLVAEPDARLLDLLNDPFDSVTDVRQRLESAEAYLRDQSDRRSVFLTVYTEMTANVEKGINSGMFTDPTWVDNYLVAFANHYRSALLAAERGVWIDIPMAWWIAFHAALDQPTLLVQDALLGINAHINYDLPYALVDVGISPNRPAKRRDHNRINDILKELIDVVQRALTDIYDAGGYAHADQLLGSFDEDFTLVGLTESRDLAWRNAVLLTDKETRLVRWVVNWRVRAVSTGAAYFILSPSVEPSILPALRSLEQDRVPTDSFQAAFNERIEELELTLG